MADFLTFQDLFRASRDEALLRNSQLSRAAIEREGSDANVITAGGAAAADEVMGQLITVQSGLFLDSSEKTALRRLVFDRFGLLPKSAAPAVGEVDFGLPTASLAPFVIPVGTILETAAGVQLSSTSAIPFPASSKGPIAVPVRSLLAGADQQCGPNTITNIVSSIPGAPDGLTVNNPLATAGADDEESDASLRARARQFFSTARRGTLVAIVQGALAVPGVRTAQAFELVTSAGHPDRANQLIIADAFTAQLAQLQTVPPSYAAQSQVLSSIVFDALSDVRAAGIDVFVQVGQAVLLPIVLHLAFTAGADPVAVTATCKALAVLYTNGLVPGQAWNPPDLLALLKGVSGLAFTGNEIGSPNGQVIATPLQIIRTTQEIVTAPAV